MPAFDGGDQSKSAHGNDRSQRQPAVKKTSPTVVTGRPTAKLWRLPEVFARQAEIQVQSGVWRLPEVHADYQKYMQSSQRSKCHLQTTGSTSRAVRDASAISELPGAVRDPSAICRLPEVHAEQSEMQVPSADYRKYKQSSQRSECHLQTTRSTSRAVSDASANLQTTYSTCRAVRDASAGRLPDVRAGQSKCRLEITRSTSRAVSDASPVKRRVALQIACSIGRSLCQCDRLSAYRNTVACVCKKWPRLGYMYIQSIS